MSLYRRTTLFMLMVKCVYSTGKASVFCVRLCLCLYFGSAPGWGVLIFLSLPEVHPLPRNHATFNHLHFSGDHFIMWCRQVAALMCYSQIASVSSIIFETPSSVAGGSVKAGGRPCRASFTSSFCLLHHILNPTHSLGEPRGHKKHCEREERRNHYVQFINH